MIQSVTEPHKEGKDWVMEINKTDRQGQPFTLKYRSDNKETLVAIYFDYRQRQR